MGSVSCDCGLAIDRARQVEIDENCRFGKQLRHHAQILRVNTAEGAYSSIDVAVFGLDCDQALVQHVLLVVHS